MSETTSLENALFHKMVTRSFKIKLTNDAALSRSGNGYSCDSKFFKNETTDCFSWRVSVKY